jgi:hypothetical protein
MYRVLNDEPTTDDKLGRRALARALAKITGECQTPLVVGVFGSWGTGKTTFLRLIESEFDGDRCAAVWFNAWQHDQDTAPAVSLLHAMVDALNLGSELKSAISQVAVAFGSVLLQKTTTLSLDNLQKVQTLLDQEAFRVRDARSKLRSHFAEAIAKARQNKGSRIVFFVDDLDRCSPDTVMRLLEAIKLYFNIEGCVFFLGLDRENIDRALGAAGKGANAHEAHYLDKLIQLPFNLPPLADATFRQYLRTILHDDLAPCLPLVLSGLERNPRSAKRFVNDLVLRHQLALTLALPSYDPRLLALLLLFEHLHPALYKRMAARPALLIELKSDPVLAAQDIESPRLLDALSLGYVPQFQDITSYFALTDLDVAGSLAGGAQQGVPDLRAAVKSHRLWLRTVGRQGVRLDISGAALTEVDLSRQLLRQAFLKGVWLSKCNLQDADLRRASLAGAHLAGCKLGRALLRDVDLREADLSGADLRDCDLRGADLRGANLRGADMRGAIGLDAQQLSDSNTDAQTRIPHSVLSV